MAGDEILKVSGHEEIRNSILYTNFETITVLIDRQAVSIIVVSNIRIHIYIILYVFNN